ncbi:MAG: class I SAM-dependent methyltransferase [Acinetobacter sp.]
MPPNQGFTPAMGRFMFNRLYDPVIRLTREKYWRQLILEYLKPQADDVIVDVGCGTGTLLNLIAKIQPKATLIGIDPDENILKIAKEKSKQQGNTIIWQQTMGDHLQQLCHGQKVNKICSSLVLHQCPVAMKQAILQSMYELLLDDGLVVIADFGQQRTKTMRFLFNIIQLADGKQDTQPNADGIIPILLAESGFSNVQEQEVVATLGGSISIYTARK